MNTKKHISSLLALCALVTGCNRLEQLPSNKYTDENFWKNVDNVPAMLNMGYNQMFSLGKIWQDEELSDNLVNMYATADTRLIREGQGSTSTGLFASEWRWCYEGIKTANVFLDHVDAVPVDGTKMTEAGKKRMKAEMRFIRASLFFRLTNFYGAAPFFLHDPTQAEALATRRTPRAEIIARLHDEIDEFIMDLPRRDDLTAAENGRITRTAAAVLKTRMYLYDGNMTEVEEWCGKLMDDPATWGAYSLFNTATANYSAYENLFFSAYEYNTEVILDCAAWYPNGHTWNMQDYVPQSIQGARVGGPNPTQSLVDDYINLDGSPYSKPAASSATAYVYTGRDPRMTATVCYNNFVWKDKSPTGAHITQTINTSPNSSNNNGVGKNGNSTKTGYYIRKYFDVDHVTNTCEMHNNIIMMRWADVLLMYAEACAANGHFDLAAWNRTIRPIRERAGFTASAALDYPTLSNDEMKALIRRERRCELALEGLRYFDLVRWNEATSKLSGMVYGAKFYNNNTDYLSVDRYVFTDRDLLWSVPLGELEQSQALRPNNPGYGN
ncbi:MAG: RagB/SusD family nutrient uptake outer membrane protein [Rikenellaceae bacterium]|jgi:hypothetical protein|nr:RagB/SusD family nutrient uptake outer membrane protein [Rikenellaceae bacterium]